MTSVLSNVNFNDVINGAFSGFLVITLMQPFQVVKTSMMVIFNKKNHVKMTDIIKQIKSEEGIKGFYRGFIPSLMKTVFGSAIYFAALEFNKKILHSIFHEPNKKEKVQNVSIVDSTDSDLCNLENNNKETNNKSGKKKRSFTNFLAAGFARTLQAISVNPILVIKTRYEVVGFNSYNNMWDAFNHIRKEEGTKGFYSGLRTNLIKDVPYSACFYAIYELLKMELGTLGVNNIQVQALISSISASTILIILTNPLDVIRTRQQYQYFSDNADHEYKSITHGFKLIYKHEGIKGLLVGIAPRLIKKGLGSIIVWTTYESLKKE